MANKNEAIENTGTYGSNEIEGLPSAPPIVVAVAVVDDELHSQNTTTQESKAVEDDDDDVEASRGPFKARALAEVAREEEIANIRPKSRIIIRYLDSNTASRECTGVH